MNIQGYIPHFFSSWDSRVPTGNKESKYERTRPRSTSYSSNIDDSYKNYRGYAAFENYFLQSGVSEERLPFFANLAKLESGFNPTIQNTAGYPAWGYFQFMDGSWKDSNGNTRSASNVRSIAGVSVNEFLNNPILQIQSADKLANKFLASFNSEDKRLAREKGYSDSALVAGAWLAGAGGVKSFLRGNSNPSDAHGATVKQRMDEFNNYFKKGGILKFDGGDKYLEQEREHYNQQVSFNSLLPVFNIPYNLTKHKLDNVRVKHDAPWLLRDTWDEYNGVYNTITNTIHINDNYPNPIIVENHEKGHIIGQPLVKNVENLIKKWDGDIFEDGVTKDSYYDSPNEILARMYAYLMDSGYGGNRTVRDTLQFIRNERDRFTTEINADLTYADGTRVRSTRKDGRVIVHDKNIPGTSDVSSAKIYRKYNDPYDIFNRYNDRFINDLFQLFYSMNRDVQLSRKGGIIKKYNTGGPVSWTDGVGVQLPPPSEIKNKLQPYNTWTMVDNWHAPMKPSYVNSKPEAESSVLGFDNAKEVYEYILSLPGSNPAIAAGWTGVFMKESSLDHNTVNESSGARGIAQLLGDRRSEYKKWLKGRPDNWQNQISWVWEKVNNGVDDWQVYYDSLKDKVDRGIKLSDVEASHWNSMKNSKYRNYSFQNYRDKINNMYDPGDIVELMTWTFERPGNKEAHMDQRREYANAVYNQFN